MIKIQKDLDKQIKEGLAINLIPIDLARCLTTALQNNYDIKISEMEKEEYKWLYRKTYTGLIPDFYYRYQVQALYGEFLVGDVLPQVINRNPVYSGIIINYPIGNGNMFFDMASGNNQYKAKKHSNKYSKNEL